MSNRPVEPAPGAASGSKPKVAPSAEDLPHILEAIEEAERGDVLDPETSAAYLRWLESGDGPCPWTDES